MRVSIVVLKLSLQSLQGLFNNSWFKRLALFVCIACAVIVYFLLTRIDLVVHGDLYYFGLVFSSEWADPYRLYMWSIYACLVIPIAFSSLVLVWSFLEKTQKILEKPQKPLEISVKLPETVLKTTERQSKSVERIQKAPEKTQRVPEAKMSFESKDSEKPRVTSGANGNSEYSSGMIIACPKCKKVFSRPLVMLDFGGGKPKLVNVCPYCNQALGSTDEKQGLEFGVDLEDKGRRVTLG